MAIEVQETYACLLAWCCRQTFLHDHHVRAHLFRMLSAINMHTGSLYVRAWELTAINAHRRKQMCRQQTLRATDLNKAKAHLTRPFVILAAPTLLAAMSSDEHLLALRGGRLQGLDNGTEFSIAQPESASRAAR